MADRTVKLTTKLPQGDANGLADPDVIRRLMADPAQMRVGIVILNMPKIDVDTIEGNDVGKLQVHRIEVVLDDTRGDASALERLLMRAYERRTGATVLDEGLEGDVRAAFDGISIIDVEAEELARRERDTDGD